MSDAPAGNRGGGAGGTAKGKPLQMTVRRGGGTISTGPTTATDGSAGAAGAAGDLQVPVKRPQRKDAGPSPVAPPPPPPNDTAITLVGDDGREYHCELLDVFDFEAREYALLMKKSPVDAKSGDPGNDLIVMRLIDRRDGEKTTFQTIESDDEFARVVDHVEKRAREEEGPDTKTAPRPSAVPSWADEIPSRTYVIFQVIAAVLANFLAFALPAAIAGGVFICGVLAVLTAGALWIAARARQELLRGAPTAHAAAVLRHAIRVSAVVSIGISLVFIAAFVSDRQSGSIVLSLILIGWQLIRIFAPAVPGSAR